MKITVETLTKAGACDPAVEYWQEHYPNGVELTKKLLAFTKRRHSDWYVCALGCFPVEYVREAVRLGADVNAKDANGWTPLHSAAYYGHTDTFRFLVESGADVNARDAGGCTPLHSAASCGHTDTFRLLVEAGADVNAKDANGCTPLHWAAYCGHPDTADYLRSVGGVE